MAEVICLSDSPTKYCPRCAKILPLVDFQKNKARKDGRGSHCKTCKNAGTAQWRQRNPERLAALNLAWGLRASFGMTVDEFTALSLAQDHKCAICFQACSVKSRLSVDHCHTTGQIRGLLCSPCNLGIGGLKDSPSILAASLAYLAKSGQLLTTEELADLLLHQSPHQET